VLCLERTVFLEQRHVRLQPKPLSGGAAALPPEILAAAKAAWEAGKRDLSISCGWDSAAFTACASDSIDYAVMERTSASTMVQADIGWSDVGSWTALWGGGEKDVSNNVVRGDVDLREASAAISAASTAWSRPWACAIW